MKIKKIEKVLLILGLGLIVIGAALFVVNPMIVGEGFEYSGIDALVAGITSLIAFDFNNTTYFIAFALSVVTIICLFIWLGLAIAKKSKKVVLPWILCFVFIVAMIFCLFGYFVAPVELNGTSGELFPAIMKLDGQMLGKSLTIASLACFYIALILITLQAFISVLVLASNGMIGAGEAKKIEAPAPVVVAAPVEEETYEERKDREEAFIAACLATGEFEAYDELEFSAPLEGFEEEPVLEGINFDKDDKII